MLIWSALVEWWQKRVFLSKWRAFLELNDSLSLSWHVTFLRCSRSMVQAIGFRTFGRDLRPVELKGEDAKSRMPERGDVVFAH